MDLLQSRLIGPDAEDDSADAAKIRMEKFDISEKQDKNHGNFEWIQSYHDFLVIFFK